MRNLVMREEKSSKLRAISRIRQIQIKYLAIINLFLEALGLKPVMMD